ncbi:hypothetical protein VB712_05975 [Spirulina sp. CCNP1310]|uniref:hypothetical protein n=1 Tax=Spirulina sp. CCNP1310 TaxID=3110249 RepID=UPI002B2204DE|nr:hypothetical protein [Spirulina sp. CCNP1310]MEA5418767.1 hypothetical protein [Spirulina sp. CCNP1310]
MALTNVARAAEAIAAYPTCKITYNRDSWVNLLVQPSEYSADEALLICQESLETWVAWVPNHGETRLSRDLFYV